MIVTEDIEAQEVKRFYVIDAALQLGEVKIGDQVRSFGPDRALSFFDMVEHQLHDYVSTYSSSFRYLPRRAYDYLKKPPILSQLYANIGEATESCWFVDAFMVQPLVSVGSTLLPNSQRRKNLELISEWTHRSPYSPRLYNLQDLRHGSKGSSGWACLCNADELVQIMDESTRNDVIGHIQNNSPVFINLEGPENLDPLLKWIIFTKEAGLPIPNLFLSARDHREWGEDITRLADVPHSKILTSGSTISSLATIIQHMKRNGGGHWSSRLVFASAYPETKLGESIPEIISYLFSRNLSASPDELQRVLAGNMLIALPPRPSFFHYVENETAVVAEGRLGKTATGDLVRVIQILAARKEKNVVAFDFMVKDDGGKVDLDGAILTLSEPNSKSATSLAVYTERDGTLRVAGWRRTFTEALIQRRAELLTTLVRAITKSSGSLLESPSHLATFNQEFLKILQVRNIHDVLSALHFPVRISDIEEGTMTLCPDDMRAAGISNGDLVLALDAESGQWWAGRVYESNESDSRTITISRIDSKLLGLKDSVVDLVKYDGEVIEVSKATFAYDESKHLSGVELSRYLYLHRDEIQTRLQGILVGRGTTFIPTDTDSGFTCSLIASEPNLESGQLGKISGQIHLKPNHAFQEFNLILGISLEDSMNLRDVQLESKQPFKEGLVALSDIVPEISSFLNSLEDVVTRGEAAILGALQLINLVMMNRTEGKMSLVISGLAQTKFSIQKGQEIQPFIEFGEDIVSEEVLISLLYTLLDGLEDTQGSSTMSSIYRVVAEQLEDFGEERPSLGIIFGSSPVDGAEETNAYLKAISRHQRYQLDVFGLGDEFDSVKAEKTLKGVNARVYPIKSFSYHRFEGYVISALEHLVPKSVEKS
ncbi:MAG: hypothetical protein RTU92_05020 [Candidatus Thorarchaeota archaeon]